MTAPVVPQSPFSDRHFDRAAIMARYPDEFPAAGFSLATALAALVAIGGIVSALVLVAGITPVGLGLAVLGAGQSVAGGLGEAGQGLVAAISALFAGDLAAAGGAMASGLGAIVTRVIAPLAFAAAVPFLLYVLFVIVDAFRASGSSRAQTLLVFGLLVSLVIVGLGVMGFSIARIAAGMSQLGVFAKLMLPPDWGSSSKLALYVHALGETLAIAFLGTLIAATLAFPFGFLAARNAVPVWLVRFVTRRTFDTLRGVDTLIWALIWINVVGLGPFAGVLAIMSSDFGAFGKLFSEAIETADRKPVEGVLSAGGSRLHAVRFGILPQILPVILSQVLYYFESNTRSATIIGIVGAGGIGLHLSEAIRTLEWQQVSFLVLMVLVTVAVIDMLSQRLRFAIIGERRAV